MKVTSGIIKQGFIGHDVKVARSAHQDYLEIMGRVLDETRNTFVILQEKKKKVVIKETAIFHFSMPDGTIVEIDGKSIVGRPEERVKKRIRRRW
jgi:ribonuclease P protein subunit POP4